MCGIVAYVGHREACPLVIKGLKRLEYRGYDSAGVALMNGEGLKVYKKKGKVAALEAELAGREDLKPKRRVEIKGFKDLDEVFLLRPAER